MNLALAILKRIQWLYQNMQITWYDLVSFQVFVKGLISRYRSMRRVKVTCWFAQTALSPLWLEAAGRWKTAPASARRSRKTSTAGQLPFTLYVSLKYACVPLTPLPLCVDSLFTYLGCLSVVHLPITSPRCFHRAFNFQQHDRKCHLLPFDRFTHGVQTQANINFTLYEKKGKWHSIVRHKSCFFFLSWEHSRAVGFKQANYS